MAFYFYSCNTLANHNICLKLTTDNMKKQLKHLPFIIAIGLFLLGVSDYSDETDLLDPLNEPSQYYFTITFLIMFFLWKNNYFTRNKS